MSLAARDAALSARRSDLRYVARSIIIAIALSTRRRWQNPLARLCFDGFDGLWWCADVDILRSAAVGFGRKHRVALAAVTRCIANNDRISCLIALDGEKSPPADSEDAVLLNDHDITK